MCNTYILHIYKCPIKYFWESFSVYHSSERTCHTFNKMKKKKCNFILDKSVISMFIHDFSLRIIVSVLGIICFSSDLLWKEESVWEHLCTYTLHFLNSCSACKEDASSFSECVSHSEYIHCFWGLSFTEERRSLHPYRKLRVYLM